MKKVSFLDLDLNEKTLAIHRTIKISGIEVLFCRRYNYFSAVIQSPVNGYFEAANNDPKRVFHQFITKDFEDFQSRFFRRGNDLKSFSDTVESFFKHQCEKLGEKIQKQYQS